MNLRILKKLSKRDRADALAAEVKTLRVDLLAAHRFIQAVYLLAGPKPADRDGQEQPWTVDLFEVERNVKAALTSTTPPGTDGGRDGAA